MRQLKITKQITKRETISLNKYLSDVSKIESSGLSAERECELARKIREAKTDAEKSKYVEELAMSNSRFVISVAKQYENQTKFLELNDLINYGNLGMLKAATMFDETRGFKFISYAVWWIRQSILEGITNDEDVVRKPGNQVSIHNKLWKIKVKMEQVFEREPTSEELALGFAIEEERGSKGPKLSTNEIKEIFVDSKNSDKLKVGKKTSNDVDRIFEASRRSFKLDSHVNDEENTTRFVDIMESSGYDDMVNATKQIDLHIELTRRMEYALSSQEQIVLKKAFGFDGESPKTLDEIGSDLNLTRERIRQIKQKALRKLKHMSGSDKLLEYA